LEAEMSNVQLKAAQTGHPFINFDAQLERHLDPSFWMLLGEAKSKSVHLGRVPLRADTSDEIMKVYFAKGVNATTAIEGNSLSEEQVRLRIDGTLDLPPSLDYQGIEVDNMKEQYQQVMSECLTGTLVYDLSPSYISSVNAGVLANLEHEDHVVPGQYRDVVVKVGPYRAPEPVHLRELMVRLCEWLNGPAFRPRDEDQRVPFGFLRATLSHLYLAWIHPYGDGNGRTARLIEFRCLVSSGVPVPAAFALTSHYNDTRPMYYRQLNIASKSVDPFPFLRYALQGWVDRLKDLLDHVHAQQNHLAWKDYVTQMLNLSGQRQETIDRQRRLVIDLTKLGPTPKDQLRRATPKLVEKYAGKTTKTVTRDLNRLSEAGLVEEEFPGIWRASQWKMMHFLPVQVSPPDVDQLPLDYSGQSPELSAKQSVVLDSASL
jgi:Fic family protein